MKDFADREAWSRGRIAAYQLERINDVWLHARRTVPHYVELAKVHDLPVRFDSLDQYTDRMPILFKETVRDHPQRFLSSHTKPGRWHRTGGSTGTPMAMYWESKSHQHVLRSKYRNEQRHGLGIFDRKVFLWGHSGSFAPGVEGWIQKVRRPIEDRLRCRMRVSAYDLTDERLLQQLHHIQRFRPKSLYGYSSAIDLLARVADLNQIRIPSLKVAILTAEPSDTAMLGRISKRLHCDAMSEYGATECAFMACHEPSGEIRTRDDVVLLESVPNDSGSHDIVLSVLGNASFPLLRYNIADTTSAPIQYDDHGFGRLRDIQGRCNDMLVSRNGRRLHAMFVKHTLEHWPEVRRFTVKQAASGDLDVTLETNGQLSPRIWSGIEGKLVSMLDGVEVRMREVDEIQGNAAGKHRWIVSEAAEKTDSHRSLP